MVEQIPGAKMMYLIRRKPETSREELVAHWFASHMPNVIERTKAQARRGQPHPRRYFATLYDANADGEHSWDGVAQLWWDQPAPAPDEPHGTTPTDTFQQKVVPYMPWATREYVVIDGAEHLCNEPLTLNAPYPMTRSGFFKVTFLVAVKPDTDYDALFAHWLDVHVPNVKQAVEHGGGFRYVVSHSLDPENAPYAGMAELYFHDPDGWASYRAHIQPDGLETWIDRERTEVLRAGTEMVGVP